MDLETIKHLTNWAEHYAPMRPAEAVLLICNYLDSLDADEIEQEVAMGWPEVLRHAEFAA